MSDRKRVRIEAGEDRMSTKVTTPDGTEIPRISRIELVADWNQGGIWKATITCLCPEVDVFTAAEIEVRHDGCHPWHCNRCPEANK